MTPLPNVDAERIPGVSDLLTIVEAPEWKKILLDLVKSERMDPWDIDIVYLARKYLERIRSMSSNNLYVPANAVLACAILLNMKADVLRQYYVEEEESDEYVEDFAVIFDGAEDVPAEVQQEGEFQHPPEVLPPVRITTRRVTLDELLAAMERVMKAKKTVRRKPEVRPDIIDVFMEEMEREDVDRLVQETYERIKASLDSEGITTLSRVLPDNDALSVVNTLLHVLYLANEGKVNVWQEKPFDEVFISVVEDGEPSRPEETR